MAKDSLIVDVLAGRNTLIPELNRIMAAGKQIGMLQARGFNVSDLTGRDKRGRFISLKTKKLELFNQAAKEGAAKVKELTNRFDMNTLSWMFGGMALQRMGLVLTRFFIPSMDKLNKLNTAGSKKVLGMVAAWEFLKISMFETLAQTDLFGKFIELIIKGAIWVAEFAQKHPAMVQLAVAVGAIAAALGTLAIGVGIFKQLAHLGTLLGIGSKGGILGAIIQSGKGLLLWAVANPLVAGLVLVTALTIGLALKFDETREVMGEIWDKGFKNPAGNIIKAMASIIGLTIGVDDSLKFLASTGAWAFSIIGLGVGSVILWFQLTFEWVIIITKSLFRLGHALIGINHLLNRDAVAAAESFDKALDFSFVTDSVDRVKSTVGGLIDILTDVTLKGPTGLYDDLFNSSELFNTSADKTAGFIADITSEANTMSADMIAKLGVIDDDSTVIGKFGSLGEGIQDDTEFFNTLKSGIDEWQPADKHVNIFYHHIGRAGGSGTETESDPSEVSSVTP